MNRLVAPILFSVLSLAAMNASADEPKAPKKKVAPTVDIRVPGIF